MSSVHSLDSFDGELSPQMDSGSQSPDPQSDGDATERKIVLRRNSNGTFNLDLEWNAELGFIVMADCPEQNMVVGDRIVAVQNDDLRLLPEDEAASTFRRRAAEPRVVVRVRSTPPGVEQDLSDDVNNQENVTNDALEGNGELGVQDEEDTLWPMAQGEENLLSELARWLVVLELEHYRSDIERWIDENGAVMMDEVAENAMEVAEYCKMRPLEQKRLVKWAGIDAVSEVVREKAPAPENAMAGFDDLQSCRWVRLNVNNVGNAGVELSWSYRFGYVVEDIHPEPGQDIQPGEAIVAINDTSLRYLEEDVVAATFCDHFAVGVRVLVHKPPDWTEQNRDAPPRGMKPLTGWRRARFGHSRARSGYDADKMWSSSSGHHAEGPRSGAGARLVQQSRNWRPEPWYARTYGSDARSQLIRKADVARAEWSSHQTRVEHGSNWMTNNGWDMRYDPNVNYAPPPRKANVYTPPPHQYWLTPEQYGGSSSALPAKQNPHLYGSQMFDPAPWHAQTGEQPKEHYFDPTQGLAHDARRHIGDVEGGGTTRFPERGRQGDHPVRGTLRGRTDARLLTSYELNRNTNVPGNSRRGRGRRVGPRL
eukprot:GEMP01014391.1.p1 GENE.GEMP01014391.1~~GEMP01014391.1.p1  ORF type:complete len:594 (+),score=139.29 GEMP01014391.1:190-1971(+)